MPHDTTTLKQLQTIIDVQAQLTDAALDLDAFMLDVVNAAERLTNAKGAVVELVEGSDMVYRCASPVLTQFIGLRLARAGSLSGRCVEEQRVLRCDDSEIDPRVDREACRRIGVRSMICTPLFQRGEPVGVLKVMASEPSRFTQHDVQTLRLIGGALGAALGKQLSFELKTRIEKELRESQARLAVSEARTRAFLQHANDAVISMNAEGIITSWNGAAERLFGWGAGEAIGKDVNAIVVPPHLHTPYRDNLHNFARTGDISLINRRFEMKTHDRSGIELHLELSLSAIRLDDRWEILGFLHDIAERKRFEQRMHQLALEDSLTGLPNRRALMDHLEHAIARARRHGHAFALLYMDLNGFKKINDVHGHQAGDLALQEFARRIVSAVRPTDVVARLGGDEFAVLAEAASSLDDATVLATRVRDNLATPMTDPPLTLRTSIGIAVYDGQSDASTLLREADAAMYLNKRELTRSVA